jgi:hypothetical protein
MLLTEIITLLIIIRKIIVRVASSYGLGMPWFEQEFSLLQKVQTDPEAHPVACSVGSGFKTTRM